MGVTDRRAGLLFACFAIALLVIVVRAAWVQGVQGDELRADARNQQVRTLSVPAARGTIFDRNGKELAISEDTYTVESYPKYIEDPESAARKVARVLGDSNSRLRKIFTQDIGFAYVAKQVDVSQAEKVRDLAIGGIDIVPSTRRVYPQGSLAAPVIGVVGGDEYNGVSGLEAFADSTLDGADGELQVLADNRGRPLERKMLVPSIPGSDLTLSLDAGLQTHVEGVLAGIATQYEAAGVSIVAMDPQTSEILAMASYPGFDPANLDKARSQDMRDHSVGITYEPGSTFKAFTVAGALNDGLVNPGTKFALPSELQVADRTISEAHARPPITASVAEILAQSSNVGAVKIGQQLGEKRFDSWVHRFGFGKPTGITYPGEEIGIVPGYKDYSGASIGNLPIGQGIAVTPMQMVAAYAAIANGGILRPPRLITERDGKPVEVDEGTRIIKKSTASQLRVMLEGVLAAGGTASEVSVPGYTLAGKTGTAEKALADGSGYSDTDYVASFIGFAPAEDPRLLVAVVVDSPRGASAGGVVAAPAFGQIASFALPYLGIPGNDG